MFSAEQQRVWKRSVGKQRRMVAVHTLQETGAPQVTEFPIQRFAPSHMEAESVQRAGWRTRKAWFIEAFACEHIEVEIYAFSA